MKGTVVATSLERKGSAIAPTLPLVSVLVPAYNRADTIAETLDSLIQQSYPNLEIVVVDDGSTDATAQVAARYADRVRYVRQINGGLASARNRAQREARGKYLAWLDADDIAEPERIALQVACLEKLPEVTLCCSDFSAFTSDGPVASSYVTDYYKVVKASPGGVRSLFDAATVLTPSESLLGLVPGEAVSVYSGMLFDRLVWGNFVHPPTIMFRRELLQQAGELDENYSNLCDYDWLLRASRCGPIAFIDRPMLRYRLSPGQMSSDHNTVTIKLETIRIIDRLKVLDSAYYAEKRAALRTRAGKAYLGAADLEAEVHKLKALQYLLRGIWLAGFGSVRARSFAKLVLPGAIIRRLRQSRAYSAAGH